MNKIEHPEAEAVRAIIADIGQRAKAAIEEGADVVDPIKMLEAKYGRKIDKWSPDVLCAFVAMQVGTLPDGPPLHRTPPGEILDVLRRAYLSVGPRQ